MPRLENMIALVTGGANGIGEAAARLFTKEGARVVLVDLDETSLEKSAASLGDAASYVVADVSQESDVKRYVQTAVDRHGGLDVFVNNAGIEGVIQPIHDYPVDVFDKVLAVNIRGAWLGLRYVIPEMHRRKGGSIIITSSVGGLIGYAGLSAYVTSKHAAVGMMRSAALECAPLGIRVNTVNPAPIETRMMRSLEEQAAPGAPDQAKQAFTGLVPAGRYGTPEEVAQLMLFLASDESRYCTGGVYTVDGGFTAA